MASPTWALPALVVVALWTSLGGPRMLIFLAALQDVPQELTEAATDRRREQPGSDSGT